MLQSALIDGDIDAHAICFRLRNSKLSSGPSLVERNEGVLG
jgi:hypothetical protein